MMSVGVHFRTQAERVGSPQRQYDYDELIQEGKKLIEAARGMRETAAN